MATQATPAQRLARAAAGFVALGLVLYFALYVAAEALLREKADANPFHRIAAAERRVDWLILGSSHAMPLGYGGMEQAMERDTGLVFLNLGTQGAGPLYNRLAFEHFLRTHEVRHVLYVADGFAFESRTWNEDRIGDAKLLARTPWDPALAGAIAGYVRDQGVSPLAWLAYVSGFPKINNRDRFAADRWEGEAQFDRSWRASTSSVRKRVEYLYPEGMQPQAQARYLAQLEELLRRARSAGATAVVVKLPMPRIYREALPDEAGFDAALARSASLADAGWVDLSRSFDKPDLFFDSDHLNRRGVTLLYQQHLRALFTGPAGERALAAARSRSQE